MTCKIGFALAEDGQLLVATELLQPSKLRPGLTITQFRDDGTFLHAVVNLGLTREDVTSLITNVLLVISGRPIEATWTTLEISEQQLDQLWGAQPTDDRSAYRPSGSGPLPEGDLRDVLMQTPIPVTMLLGPEHIFAFINPGYVRILGRAESVLGKTVREALPELAGQRFFGLLDGVYKTGEPFTGREMRALLLNEKDGRKEEFFFDFIYSPLRDRIGKVYGILCQATDVTERVLARHVSEGREATLYRQWAELEALYRAAPIGLALVDARGHRVLRINETNARLLGSSVQNLLGRRVFELFPNHQTLQEIYKRVASGEEIRRVRFHLQGPEPDTEPRSLLVNFSLVLDPHGEIEAIAFITIDAAELLADTSDLVLSLDANGLDSLPALKGCPGEWAEASESTEAAGEYDDAAAVTGSVSVVTQH